VENLVSFLVSKAVTGGQASGKKRGEGCSAYRPCFLSASGAGCDGGRVRVGNRSVLGSGDASNLCRWLAWLGRARVAVCNSIYFQVGRLQGHNLLSAKRQCVAARPESSKYRNNMQLVYVIRSQSLSSCRGLFCARGRVALCRCQSLSVCCFIFF